MEGNQKRSLQASFAKTGNVPENGAKDVNKTPTVEEYVGTLLSRIQPAAASEYRRRTVAQYVQDVIAQAFQPAVEASYTRPCTVCINCKWHQLL